MAFDPNTFSQNPMLAAIMARTMVGASGMPVPQEAMPGGGAIEGTIQQTAEQEVDLPKLIGERLDLKMAPPASRGGVLAGGLAIALQNAWNARTKNKEIELENAIKKNEAVRNHKIEMANIEMKTKAQKDLAQFESNLKENAPSQLAENKYREAATRNLDSTIAKRAQGGSGGGVSSTGISGPISDEQLQAAGINPAFYHSLSVKGKEQIIKKFAGKKVEDELAQAYEAYNKIPKADPLNPDPINDNQRAMWGDKIKRLEAAKSSYGSETGSSETSGSKANSLLQKGLSGGTQAAPPTQTSPMPAIPTDIQGNRQYTPEEIINIINATKGNMPNNPKIKFDKKKF